MRGYCAEHTAAPVLAIDIGHAAVRALLHLPETPAEAPCLLQLPAPDRLLAGRIRACTAARANLYLQSRSMGPEAFAALSDHRASGSGASVHPDTADILTDKRADLERLGIAVARQAPPCSVRVPSAEYGPCFWTGLCDMAGLPRPQVFLVSAMEHGFLVEGADGRAASRHRLFAGADARGLPLDSLMADEPDKRMVRLSAIRRMTGFPAIDAAHAFILGLMALPDLTERSFRQGLTLLHLHTRGALAALVFQERLLGFLDLPFGPGLSGNPDAFSPSLLLEILDDFRLGWFPEEKANDLQGFVWHPPRLPPEAEGFAPLFAVGALSDLMAGHARVLDARKSGAFNNCRGLVRGYDRLKARNPRIV